MAFLNFVDEKRPFNVLIGVFWHGDELKFQRRSCMLWWGRMIS
jgi:hypothetical protein